MAQGNGDPLPHGMPSGPQSGSEGEDRDEIRTFREYLKRFVKTAEVRQEVGQRMTRNSRFAKRLAKLARKALRYEGRFLIGAGPSTKKRVNRLQDKIGDVTAGQVIDAALTHLEWKVDREAEGLVVFAGEPPDEEELPDWLEAEE